MDVLLQYLDADTAGIVCSFLINGDDYAPFTLEDIFHLKAQIHNWAQCMTWAARVGNVPVLKYAGQKKGIAGINWERCAEIAAGHGHLEGFKYAASKAFYYGWASWQIGLFCAIRNERLNIVQYASTHFSVGDWGACLVEAAATGNIELVKYLDIKYTQSSGKTCWVTTWQKCFQVAQKNRHLKVMDFSRKKLSFAVSVRKTVGC